MPEPCTVEPFYQNESATIYLGECLDVLRELPANSVDALVTDPPAGIGFMGKDWDDFRRSQNIADVGRENVFGRTSARAPEYARRGRTAFVGFMTAVMAECLRVMKPGAHGLVWSIPRTSHWTAWALEDAGFEVRDRIGHLFGSGFPKSLDVSKAIDAAAGAEREVVGKRTDGRYASAFSEQAKRAMGDLVHAERQGFAGEMGLITEPSTDAAKQWDGWGTALKPACEDWWLVRKPLQGTVAANVLTFGTGALNIDDCRIEGSNGDGHWSGDDGSDATSQPGYEGGFTKGGRISRPLRVAHRQDTPGKTVYGSNGPGGGSHAAGETTVGRWPANVITDGSSEVLAAFPDAPGQLRALTGRETPKQGTDVYGDYGPRPACEPRDDFGSAARFFYTAKASKEDREEGLEDLVARQQDESRKEGHPGGDNPRNRGLKKRANHHPTVKPVALMRYLCRLITQPGGVVLDPFMGSGSTGKAAYLEGLRFIGIDKDESYCEIAARRCELRQRSLFAAK